MTNNLEDEIRAIVVSMDNQESQESQDNTQSPHEVEDIYVLIVREHEEVEEDQSKVVESEPVNPPLQQKQSFPYLTLGIVLICLLPMLASILLQFYLLQNPPVAIITLVPKSQQVSLSGTLQLGRLLPSLSISQSQITRTTGRGHQDARNATGTVTFYNGLFTQQFIASGTVYTGSDGVEIITTQDATIPQGSPNLGYGTLSVTAQALKAGSQGNIRSGDIDIVINNGLLVRNNEFYNGQDERNFQTVAKKDIENVAGTLKTTLAQSVRGALQGQGKPTEQLFILPCTPTDSSDHQLGQETREVKITVSETCSAVAYNSNELLAKASDLLSRKALQKVGTDFNLFGQVQVSIIQATVTRTIPTLIFSCQGTWVYAISLQAQQSIKLLIAGKPKDEAIKVLLSLPGIERASIEGDDNSRLPRNITSIHLQIIIQSR